jgi:NAD(P)-dependent dehydrogenase (short-subunit alcohol dehydrogenase family)
VNLGLADRVVVATAGGGGIVNATVRRFLDEGAHVVTGDLDVSALEGLERVTSLELDLLADGAPQRLVDAALAEHGRVDVLVNGLGLGRTTEFLDTTDESWRWHFEVNLMTAVRMTRGVLPGMLARGRGVVISISSGAGREPQPYVPEYSVAKAALIAWSDVMATTYAPQGIRFNTVAPGTVATPIMLRTMEEHFAPRWGVSRDEAVARFVAERGVPMGRLMEPEEPAAAIVFLASDAASGITGEQLSTDGGALKAP